MCRPSAALSEDACARRIITTLARHAFRRPARAADVKTLMAFYQEGRNENGTFDDGIEAALQRVLADRRVRVPRRTRARGPRGRQELPRQRPRARLAPVVLPLEQHSGRRADRARGAGPAQKSGGAREAGAADARRSEVGGAHRQLHGPVAERPRPEDGRACRQHLSRTSTTTSATRSSARPSCSSTPSSTRIAACSIC